MRLALIVSALVLALVAGLLVVGDSLEEWLLSRDGLEWLREQGPMAGLVGAALIVSDLFLPVPATGVMAALGEIYGGLVGGAYALLGTFTAGMTAYGLVRLLGRRAAVFVAGADNLARLQRFFERRGAWAIALTRALPLLPEVLCALAGLAPMPARRFVAALACGSVPFAFVFACIGSAGDDEPVTTMVLAILLPLVVFPPVWWWIERGASLEETASPDPDSSRSRAPGDSA